VLSVKVLGLSSGNSYSLSLYDIFGRMVSPFTQIGGRAGDGGSGAREGGKETESEIQLDVSNFPRGLYLVVRKDGSNIIGSSKLVISK
jgi:hypothetical protein